MQLVCVSELTGLRLNDLHLDVHLVQPRGKGDKESDYSDWRSC